MVPATYPSTFASNGQQQMVVYFLTSVAGLQRWSDYIPVKLVQTGAVNSYNNNGFIAVTVLAAVSSQTQAWKEYIPVYVDNNATGAWQVSAVGYIPYSYVLFADASLQLDFTNGASLDSRVTFTRTTTATRTNSSGVIESVAINGPRFDYNPTTLAPNGLLIEEQRVNLLTRSEEFQTTWTNERSSEQADVIISPASTLTGDKLVEDTTASNTHLILQGVSGLASGSTLSFTVYLKAAERISARLQINDGTSLANAVFANYDVSTGLASSTQSIGTFTGATSAITPVGNGWFRCSISGVATGVTAVQCRIFLVSGTTTVYTGDGTSGIYIWGAQLEVGAFPTSYIPTVASQVTRTADVATMTGTNFSSWYNATEGTMYGEFNSSSNSGALDGSGGGRGLATINDGTGSNRFRFAVSLQTFQTTVSGSTVVSITPVATTAANTNYKFAAAFKVNDYQAARNGVLGTAATSGVLPIVNQLQIGFSTSTGGILNGTIKQIVYYPRRLANAELQAITS
jgi:hypothetical protein